jgi:hypothetical protein
MKNAQITFRKSRKIVRSSTVSVDVLKRIFVDVWPHDVSKALMAFSDLSLGNTVKFKYRGLTATVKPIYNSESL